MKAKMIIRLKPVEDADILRLPRGKRPENPGEWVHTHSTSRYSVWVKAEKGGAKLKIFRTKRAFQLGAQHGVEPRWVGQCTFAFFVEEEEV